MTKRLYILGIRLFLGILFLFASEILLWTSDPLRSPLDWGGRLLGYTILATVVLDLAVRYRIRDEYDTMAVLAIYALLAGLLITPTISFADFPATLLTRIIGGHGLVGIEVFGFFLVLTNRENRRMRRLLIPSVLWIGFYWGTWLRWMPVFTDLFSPIRIQETLVFAGIIFAIAIILWVVLQNMRLAITIKPMDFYLSTPEWLFILLMGFIFLTAQGLQNAITIAGLVAIILLIGVAWVILWYRRSEKSNTLMENHVPPKPTSFVWVLVTVIIFCIATVFAYSLPLVGNNQINQLWLMEIGFAIVGTLWYPLIAIVIAFRGVDNQMRTEY